MNDNIGKGAESAHTARTLILAAAAAVTLVTLVPSALLLCDMVGKSRTSGTVVNIRDEKGNLINGVMVVERPQASATRRQPGAGIAVYKPNEHVVIIPRPHESQTRQQPGANIAALR